MSDKTLNVKCINVLDDMRFPIEKNVNQFFYAS